ncbi:MAG: hypothetical protein LC689_06745 [Myxococcales bacterium]|nr:hypothetical protein [Myxococcales bacterium]
MILLLAMIAAASGQHDFDFAVGTWKTHVRRLKDGAWSDTTGTVSTRRIWNGKAYLEEIELGALHGLALRLFDPASGQWRLYWANASLGALAGPPAVGEFRDGRGEFYDSESIDGKVILVRHVFSNVTASSYHFEQAFSSDRGKTWEANWIADLTRTGPEPLAEKADAADRNRDFDFNFGKWKTRVSRLTAKKTWSDYEGTSEVTPVWNGRASLLEVEVKGPAGAIEGLGLRLYDPAARQWNLNWANSRDPELGPPIFGEFKDGRGEFVDVEAVGGRSVFVRNVFVLPSKFEQAFSSDGARTWDPNWIMTFER